MGCTSPTTERFPEAREMSRGRSLRDISRAEGYLEVRGDVEPNSSRFKAVYGHSLIINPSLGMYQEIHPCRTSSIDSVKINTSLPMMWEWVVHPLWPLDFPRPSRCPLGFALETSLGAREISWSSGMYNPFSHHWQGSIDFNTVRSTHSPQLVQ